MEAIRDLPPVELSEIEFAADDIDLERAKKAYDEVGFIVVRGLLQQYMAPLLEEIEASVAVAHTELAGAKGSRYGWLTESGAVFSERSMDMEPEPGRKQLIVAPILQTSSEVMLSASDDPRLLVGSLLEGELSHMGAGQCMYKEPRGGATGLHQDGSYTKVDGYDAVATAFTYVVPTSIERGCIWLIPYSHKLEILPHDDDGPNEGCVRKDLCSWDDAIPLPGGPGDTLIWQWRTIHGSRPNYTDQPRPTVVARYGLPAEAKLLNEKGLGQW